MDPLASKYPSLSPYNYCLNSPVNNFDPDGKTVFPGIMVMVQARFQAGYQRGLNGSNSNNTSQPSHATALVLVGSAAGAASNPVTGVLGLSIAVGAVGGSIIESAGELAGEMASENSEDGAPVVTPEEGSDVAVEIELPDGSKDRRTKDGKLDKRYKNQKDKKAGTEKKPKPEPQTPDDNRGVVDSVLELIGEWFGS